MSLRLETETAKSKLQNYLDLHHPGLKIEELEIADAPGYWRRKEACGGKGVCRHPLHSTLFNDEPCHHTISFDEFGVRDRGKFIRPYRVWEALRPTMPLPHNTPVACD